METPDRHRQIRVLGARQHNLKGVDLSIPRRAVTVLTGPSGSGKSSLAFDTVYAEGQRRYIESLSTYAKQFLEQMEKPAVERVEGVSPAVAIDQRNTVQTSRSTVGTVTEVYDFLRLLWARVGTTVCPDCEAPVEPDTVTSAADEVLAELEGSRAWVAFPLELSEEISHAVAVTNLRSQGYLRVLADGREVYLPELEVGGQGEAGEDAEAAGGGGDEGAAVDAPDGGSGDESSEAAGGGGPRDDGHGDAAADEPDLTAADELLVVVDRLMVDPEERERLADALAAAFAEGDGVGLVVEAERRDGETVAAGRRRFDEAFRCDGCGRAFEEPRPALFSFNSAAGACPECEGFGATLEYDGELIVPDPSAPAGDGALDPWTKPRYTRQRRALRAFLERRGVDPATPWRELPDHLRAELMEGSEEFQGMLPFLRSRESKKYKRYIRVFLRQYQKPVRCRACGGDRLRPEALNVKVGGRHVSAAADETVSDLLAWLGELELAEFRRKVAERILEELTDRLEFLEAVGLGYLTLDRQARTLSGGEMQRIRLARCLGSRLVDTLYVLDEPTIGLHPHDVERFLDVLLRLRAGGNTVLMVEHEPEVMKVADRLVEMGPGSGDAGGEVVFEGSYPELMGADTTTGELLAGRGGEPARDREEPGNRWLRLRGARLHNIDGVDAEIPLGRMTVVTGVSGAGKSTLVDDLLFHALESALEGETSAREHLGEETGEYEALEGAGALDEVVRVDQSPIGRTPRSIPVTYIDAFTPVRELFADQPLAKERDYEPGHFSFNVEGGRCEACKGAGEEEVEMVFMADVSSPCEVCGGKRFRPDVLEVEYRGRSIHDVLQMTVDRAIRFFLRQDRIGQALWQLQRVGLGYLRLGQPANTLSGGEAQRLKVARELARAAGSGQRIYLLDEPTVGLGLGEIGKLIRVLDQLVDAGHTVLVVEHDLEVIRSADWVIDLGPGPAEQGGEIVAAGSPEAIMDAEGSLTGRHLRRHAREEAAEAGERAAG